MGIIVLSSLAFVLQSEPSLASWGGWAVLDTLVAIIFTAEYALRIFVAPDGRGDEVDEQDAAADAASGHYPRRYTSPAGTPWQARLRCALQPLVLVDLAAILPFWLGLLFFFLPDALLSPVRVLRLVRILRMLRLAHESQELRTLALCVRRCMPALRLLLFFVALQVRCSRVSPPPYQQPISPICIFTPFPSSPPDLSLPAAPHARPLLPALLHPPHRPPRASLA
jgi:voltage-gated potassium channel